jgi:hypothetical protein
MSRKLFLDIVYVVWCFDNYFICKKDCTGMVDFSSLQKYTAALRMLAYGAPGDAQDDYIRMAESTAMECMSRFCRTMMSVFGSDYLRTHNEENTARILAQNAERGFPGMLVASIVYIGNGRAIRLLGRVCTKVTKAVAVWY